MFTIRQISLFMLFALSSTPLAAIEHQTMPTPKQDSSQYMPKAEQEQQKANDVCPPPCVEMPDGRCVITKSNGSRKHMDCDRFPGTTPR